MADYNDDPLESLLDEQSDDEFGAPEIRDRYEHSASEEKTGDLKHWSAEDFASIYVRFRPHLERHARRYLSNAAQAEEIVQDAFLYLMTSLPEIDTELGVLKFLKWKIKLLALDVLRSSSQRREVSVPEHTEFASDDADLVAEIERAEDSAVIRLALAKLNPRQREVLVASVYEEKSADVIAEQMGLTPNATRQLLHRAKSGFRKALIGEAEVQGKSITQVLSIATKKAAIDIRENASKVGTFIVLVAVSVGILPSLISPGGETLDVAIPTTPSVEEIVADGSNTDADISANRASPSDLAQSAGSAPDSIVEESTPDGKAELIEQSSQDQTTYDSVGSEMGDENSLQSASSITSNKLSNAKLANILKTDVAAAGFYENSYSPMLSEGFRGISVEVFGGTGISAFLDVNPADKTIDNAVFQMLIDGEKYFGIATATDKDTLSNPDGSTVYLEASEFYVVDESGNVFDESPLAKAEAKVTLDLDETGKPLAASLMIQRF